MLKLCKEDVLAASNEDVQLTKSIKAGILAKLEAKYDNNAVRKLMCKCTFLDLRYYGGFERDGSALGEIKKQSEAKMSSLERQVQHAPAGAVAIRVERRGLRKLNPKSKS